jgi:hypothetical protein
MKITEIHPVSLPKSPLETFCQKKFSLELNGFELLALKAVCGKVGGIGAIRSVFSPCEDTPRESLVDKLDEIPDLVNLYREIDEKINTKGTRFPNYIDDNLWDLLKKSREA